MGTTIFIKGILKSSSNMNKLFKQSIEMVRNNEWKFEEIKNANYKGIIIYPHERSEPLSLVFNEKIEIDTFVKTVYAPNEIHNMIINFIYSLKPLFKQLQVIDETGYWDELNVRNKNPTQLLISEIPNEEVENKLIRIKQFNIDEIEDKWFWDKDYDFSLLHLPTILLAMRLDLDIGNKSSLDELLKKASELGFTPEKIDERFPEMVLILLVSIWIHLTYSGKISNKKATDIVSFSWTVAEACFGYHGGFINQKHSQGVKAMKEVLTQKQEPEDSIRYLLAIRRFYGL